MSDNAESIMSAVESRTSLSTREWEGGRDHRIYLSLNGNPRGYIDLNGAGKIYDFVGVNGAAQNEVKQAVSDHLWQDPSDRGSHQGSGTEKVGVDSSSPVKSDTGGGGGGGGGR